MASVCRLKKETPMPKLLSHSLLLACLLLLLTSQLAQAQIPVIDVSNLSQNTVTAIESVLTTIQTILIEANQILELTPLDDIAVAGGIAEDMALLGQLVEEAEGLSYDIGSIQSQIDVLFHLDSAPETRDGLTERLAAIKTLKYQCYSTAARVQTLMRTALGTVEHLQGLLDTLGGLVGNMQGNQTVGQFSAVSSKHLANLDVQIASFHRAQTVDRLSEDLVVESINRIQQRRLEDWPGF
jgi:conjugal transfer/entry exclusion protein